MFNPFAECTVTQSQAIGNAHRTDSSELSAWVVEKKLQEAKLSTGVKRCTTDGQSIMNGLKQGLRNRNHRSTTELSKLLARSNANSHEPLFEVLAIFQQARSTWLDGNLGNQNPSFFGEFPL